MEDVQERFIDQHARERLERKLKLIEKNRKQRQKKLEQTDWFEKLNKGEVNDTRRIDLEMD